MRRHSLSVNQGVNVVLNCSFGSGFGPRFYFEVIDRACGDSQDIVFRHNGPGNTASFLLGCLSTTASALGLSRYSLGLLNKLVGTLLRKQPI